jgi:hypothetical protein
MNKDLSFQPARASFVSLTILTIAAAATSWAAGAPRGLHQGKDQDSSGVVLKTPSGGFEFSGKVKASEIGLPVYPGAKQVPEKEKDNGSLTFNLSRTGKPDFHFLVAKFETQDSVDQVRDFYKKKLGHEVSKFTEKTDDGGMAFEMRKGDQQRKYVQIKTDSGKTEIDLVRIDGVSFSDDDSIEVK